MAQIPEILRQISTVQLETTNVAQSLFQLADRSRPIEEHAAKNVNKDVIGWITTLQQFCRTIEEYEGLQSAPASTTSSKEPKFAPPILHSRALRAKEKQVAAAVAPWEDMTPLTRTAISRSDVKAMHKDEPCSGGFRGDDNKEG